VTMSSPVAAPRGRLLLLLGGLLLYFLAYTLAWRSAPTVAHDGYEYIDLAQRISNGTWTEPHDRTPGYPLILAAFDTRTGSPNRSLFYFQLLLHAATVGLLTLVLKRLGATAALSMAFAMLLLLPPFVDGAAYVLTECFTGFLLAGMTYSLVRWLLDRTPAFVWLAGLFGAAAFLARPVYLLLGPATAVVLWVNVGRKHRLRMALALTLPSLLVCASLISINYAKFSYAGLTPKVGFMLFTRTLHFLERIPDNQAEIREVLIRHRDRSMAQRGSSHTGTQFMWDGGQRELLRTTGKSKAELSKEMLKLNLKLIASAPLQYLLIVVQSIAGTWFPPATYLASFGSRAAQLVWSALHFVLIAFYGISLCYFVTALAVRVAGHPLLSGSPSLQPCTTLVESFLHLCIWYTVILSSMIEVGEPRYMRPVSPMLVLAVFLFLLRWEDLRRQDKRLPSAPKDL
jgi:4-amino-4-deoxy-L-arabinose transferase-like glycosyltransferase